MSVFKFLLQVKPGDAQYYLKYRPVFRDSAPGSPVSPNLAGRLAASFALCSQIFASDQAALAQQCLTAAENVYALAKTFPTCEVKDKVLLTTAPFAFYPEVRSTCPPHAFLPGLLTFCLDRVVFGYAIWRHRTAPCWCKRPGTRFPDTPSCNW